MNKIIVYIQSKEISSLLLEEGKEYIIGRSKEADIYIRDNTLSRQHIKIYYDGQNWKADCLSKFNELMHEGSNTKSVTLEKDTEFLMGNYLVKFYLEDLSKEPDPIDFEIQEQKDEVEKIKEQVEFEDSIDEEDTAVNFQMAEPFIHITDFDKNEKTLKLEGAEWIIGRSDECLIQIHDTKASRKHCTISKNETKYFLTDLGSSNGTYLNYKKMKLNKTAPLNSGDIIRIGRTELKFELIDENFNKKIENLPIIVQANPLQLANKPAYSLQIRNQGALQNAGAIKLGSAYIAKNKNNKKIFRMVILSLVCLGIYLIFGEDSSSKNLASSSANTEVSHRSPFQSLPKEDQDLVIRFYDLAYRYYIDGQYQRALNETQKIHRLLPESGYLDLSVDKDSKTLERHIKAAIDIEKQKQEVQKRQERQKRLVEEVNSIVNRCDQQARPGTSVEAARACLSTALELDPENQQASAIITRLELEQERRLAAAQQQSFVASQVRRGEALFNQARDLERQNKILDAISAYERHIASTFPDPNNLKAQSQTKRQELSIQLKKKIESLTKEATAFYESKNYKNAIYKLNEALKLDPSVTEARDLLSVVNNELNKDMQTIYSNSVLEESLGNIEAAKSMWRKILETDVESGTYYRRAESKLRNYGN